MFARWYHSYMKQHQLESELHAKLHFVRSFDPRTQTYSNMRYYRKAR
jgi:hypothetical protein